MSDKSTALALEILAFARNSLIFHMRFMDAALCFLELEIHQKHAFASDGEKLYFQPKHVFSLYKGEQNAVNRNFLHVVMHYIFKHPFVGRKVDMPRWDLACDVAVENVISDLKLSITQCARERRQAKLIERLRETVNPLTAEKLYRHFTNGIYSDEDIEKLRRDFYADDHILWYEFPGKSEEKSDEQSNKGGSAGNGGDGSGQNSSDSGTPQPDNDARATREEIEERWHAVSERTMVDIETASKIQGDCAGVLTQNLRTVTREQYDYSEFLRKFAVLGEEIKLNDDEFDYIFYTYGLSLYKNVPLIEPLEYKEVKRVREFVIAIDTSGSVSGELVQAFLQKTYNILMQAESFFTKINLRILQCDAAIQADYKITSRREFDDCLSSMQLHGFGGTDFRPVFRYVDDLIATDEFSNLKGLIYFTDGYGTYPERKPQYETAFVFIETDDKDLTEPKVPVWAIRLILQQEQLYAE